MVSRSKEKEILYCNFNQDQSCFAIGTHTGFKIYSTTPLKETISRDLKGGIGIVEMLYKCNILALVGGGDSPKYPMNKLIIWDDHQSKCVTELSFKSNVKQVKLKTDLIVASIEDRVYVYVFKDMKLLDLIETCKNPEGIFAINTDPKGTLLACPAKTVGHVSINCYGVGKPLVFKAHKSQLECMELNYSGSKLATASAKGTIIRVFNVSDGTLVNELRRGADNAQIFSLAFDRESNWLACSSDSLTIHIFSITSSNKKKDKQSGDVNGELVARNPKSKLSFMKGISSYFGSEWSFAQFKVFDRRTKLTFGQENSLYIAGYDGSFFNVTFDPVNGGSCLQQFEGRYM